MKKSGVLLLLGLLSLFQTQAQETNITAEAKADTVRMTLEVWGLDGGFVIETEPGTIIRADWGDGCPIEVNERGGYLSMFHTYEKEGIYNITIWTESLGQLTHIKVENRNGILESLDLSGCTSLETLECVGHFLTTLNVSGCRSLKRLYCYGNQLLSNLDVSGCTSLTELYCGSNPLITLDLSDCTELEALGCSNNQWTNLVDVSSCGKLKWLDCSSNQLTSLDVSKNTALTLLDCSSNQLTSLDVSGCTALERLYCRNNQLTTLKASGCTALTLLRCENNQLTSLDVSNCTQLNYLRCDNNLLTKLDVSGCTALQYLYCWNNQLTSLDVSGCTALADFRCHYNQLPSLDVRQNAALQVLSCSGNQLKSLDLSGNEMCQIMACEDNHISLSNLYPLMVRRTTETYHQFSPQSDTVSLAGGEIFDLSGEMQFGSSATKWSVLNPDSTAVASGTFEETNGKFRFLKKGDYRLVLQNDEVRQYLYDGSNIDESAVVFTWVVKVLSTPPPLQDTILMKVVGTSAEFSFTADKNAMYCVDWGDGSEEKQVCTAGEEKTLTHTYDADGTYDIVFYCEGKEKPKEIELVWVEGGMFTMGCTSEQGSDCSPFESPTHSVTLDGYYISKYEITQAQYEAVMGTNPSHFQGMNLPGDIFWSDNLPVENVSWNDAKAFCEKLSQKTGKQYALPTEAQWEFAARGGNKSKGYKYSGSNTLDSVAWGVVHTVATKAPNELGIYDMSGNVEEWCADWWGIYSGDAVKNPTGPTRGINRVTRGGYGNGTNSHVSYRTGFRPISTGSFLGFRVVCLP